MFRAVFITVEYLDLMIKSMDLIVRFIVIWLLSYPGSFIVWLFRRKTKTFAEVRNEGSLHVHAMITALIIGAIIVAIKNINF